jgi:hypothetical protein
MTGEIDLHGVLVTPILLWAAMAYALTALLHRLLDRAGFYRLVWHRALFDAALFVVILGGVGALTQSGLTP